MTEDSYVLVVRAAWLTLCGMMLLSRLVFQAAGAERMRAFLDAWQAGPVKRVWGGISLTFALLLIVAMPRLDGVEVVMAILLLAVLVVDGLVNVLPAGFRTFKDGVQERWVRRRGTGDREMFTTINAGLAAAALTCALAVALYEPLPLGTLAVAAALSVLLTAGLVAANGVDLRRRV